MVKVAMVGAGFCANVHVNAYKQVKNAEVVAIMDILEEKAKKLAKELDVHFYTDIDDLLKNKEIDSVDICIPIDKHAEVAIRAANASKHVLIEKPITLSDIEQALWRRNLIYLAHFLPEEA